MKRQGGMTEETPQQLWVPGETPSLATHAGLDLVCRVRGDVREPAVLTITPEKFHGVEVGRIRRKPDDMAPRVSNQPLADEGGLVSASTIPEQDERSAHMTGEMAKKPQDLRAPDVAAWIQGQGQGEAAPPRRHDQSTDAGDLLVRARRHGQRRCRAAGRPCAA